MVSTRAMHWLHVVLVAAHSQLSPNSEVEGIIREGGGGEVAGRPLEARELQLLRGQRPRGGRHRFHVLPDLACTGREAMKICQTLPHILACFQLYRHRLLKINIHFAAFLEIYKIF